MKAGVDYTGVTVSFYCHDGKGNFLLHKRSQTCRDEQGTWDFGGGKLEFGEDLEDAVLREVREEYCCEGEIQEKLPAVSRIRDNHGVKTHWVSVSYIIKVEPEDARIGEPDDMDEIGWFRLDALPDPLHSIGRLRLAESKELFDRYGGQ